VQLPSFSANSSRSLSPVFERLWSDEKKKNPLPGTLKNLKREISVCQVEESLLSSVVLFYQKFSDTLKV